MKTFELNYLQTNHSTTVTVLFFDKKALLEILDKLDKLIKEDRNKFKQFVLDLGLDDFYDIEEIYDEDIKNFYKVKREIENGDVVEDVQKISHSIIVYEEDFLVDTNLFKLDKNIIIIYDDDSDYCFMYDVLYRAYLNSNSNDKNYLYIQMYAS